MEYKKNIGKKEFRVVCDKERILKSIQSDREEFEDNYYQRCYTVGHDDGYLTEDEFNENLDEMVEELEAVTTEEFMSNAIDKAQKKKNGTFYKNRIFREVGCDNTVYITEWHNTWIYNTLSIKAIDDYTLEIRYEKKTDTPG